MSKPMIAMILQGGGALGAYQAGVFEQLAENDFAPDWLIGTSIGAINGAIIAGNPPEDRVAKLISFWHGRKLETGWLHYWFPKAWTDVFSPFAPQLAIAAKDSAVLSAMTVGVQGFFKPRRGATLDLSAPVALDQAGFYDTSPLRQTLLDHVDFDYLNAGAVRLSVCAVDVERGEMVVFDTAKDKPLGPEHIMASGALPPAFPPILIDGRAYWDGGIYSNTPLEVLLNEDRDRDAQVFMIDLWDPSEALPKSMAGVMDRVKSIQYSGRASTQMQIQARISKLQQTISTLIGLIPNASMEDVEIARIAAKGCDRTVNVVRLIMKALDCDNQFKDVDFSVATVDARWAAGKADAARALAHQGWMHPVPNCGGLVIHELDQI